MQSLGLIRQLRLGGSDTRSGMERSARGHLKVLGRGLGKESGLFFKSTEVDCGQGQAPLDFSPQAAVREWIGRGQDRL